MDEAGPLGVRQNARLTSLTAVVLLVGLALEGITILRIGPLIVPHIVIGFALLAPVALKLSTTGYKIVRYYAHAPAYVAEGPPPVARRLLGPVVIVTTVLVLGTGVVLVVSGARGGPWLLLHKASFILWFGAMTVHVLMHLARVARATANEYLASRPPVLAGRAGRQLTLGVLALAGLALALWSLGIAHTWTALR